MFALLIVLSACDSEAPPAAAPVAPLVALPPTPGAAPTAPSAPSADVVSGTVAETVPAGAYTYARVTTADGEVWAASTGDAPAVGATVKISTHLPMKDFHSESLGRDFPLVYFVEAWDGSGPPARTGGASLPSGHPSVAADAAPSGPTGIEQVAPAAPAAETGPPAGDKTVAEVWAGRKALAGRQVTVKGKVVKFTRGVLGSNWAHIQDGSGEPGTNDLTVTTKAEATIGDTVMATGVVAVDRDFGAGYTYEVIVTDASLAIAK